MAQDDFYDNNSTFKTFAFLGNNYQFPINSQVPLLTNRLKNRLTSLKTQIHVENRFM